MRIRGKDKIDRPQPLRVLQILEAATGGTRRHLDYLLRHLDKEKFSLSLIYSPLRDPHFAKDLDMFQRLGITLYNVPMRREISPWHDLTALMKITRIIQRGRFDIVHAHSSKAGMLGRLAARLRGVKAIIYSAHSFAFQYAPHSLRGWIYRWIERLAGCLHHQFLCVSQGERNLAIQYRITPPKRIHVIPNAIAQDDLQPSQPAQSIKNLWEIGRNEVVIGMVAHFRPQKGYNHFIDAIPRILQRCPCARFLIIGDGPLLEQAHARIQRLGVEPSVILAGYQTHPPDFYQIIDIFVLSSLWEGMPYVILEAMAMGLPVIATNIAGTNELVVHEGNGFLVPEMNSEQIAAQVIRLIEIPELRTRFGEASLRIIQTMPGIKNWVCHYAEFYEAAAQS